MLDAEYKRKLAQLDAMEGPVAIQDEFIKASKDNDRYIMEYIAKQYDFCFNAEEKLVRDTVILDAMSKF